MIRGQKNFRLPSRGRKTDDFLFVLDGEQVLVRRQGGDLQVFPGTLNPVPAATHIELVFDVLAMALDGFDTQAEGLRDLFVAKP